MAKKLDDLIIGIQLQSKALEQGMKEVKRQLNSHTREVKETGKHYDELAVTAGYAFYKIAGVISSATEKFNEYRNAMVGLKSITEGAGGSFSRAQAYIEEFISDGLVPASNAATALKNLLARGFSMDEAADIMNRFKDSAAFGRQAALSLGEAVQSATEGLKNENSILVDNAGVTKNVSKMWEEFAKSIGKSTNDLTIAEKRQAEYLGIMRETQHQVGDAAKYAKEYSGAQARAAAETLKLQQAVGGALVPGLQSLLSVTTPIISFVTSLIEQNPILAGSIISMVATFAALTAGALALAAALKALKPAIEGVTFAMSKNPWILGATLALTAVAGAVAAINAQIQKAKKAQEEYNAAVEKYNKIKREGITRDEVPAIREQVTELENLTKQYDILTQKMKQMQEASGGMTPALTALDAAEKETGISANKLAEAFNKFGISIDIFKGNTEEARKQIDILTDAIREAERVTLEELNDQAKLIAQKRVAAQETQNIINVYKSAEQGSKEWLDAQKKLAEQFPQFSTASGIMISAIEAVSKAQEDAVKVEWKNLQDKIKLAVAEIDLEIKKKEAILATNEARLAGLSQLEGEIGGTALMNSFKRISAEIQKQKDDIQKQKDAIGALNELANTPLDKITGIAPLSEATRSYENKALESSLRIMEHKKRMNQLSLEDEVRTLTEILQKYAKTSEEKMDIEERLFEAKEAIRDRDTKAAIKSIEDQRDALQRRTDFSFDWIDRQKLYGELDAEEEIAAINRIIAYHKEALQKMLADTRISQDEKLRIQEEEMKFIREQEDKIYSLRKAAVEKAVTTYIDAMKKQYDWEERQEEDRLREKLRALDREYAQKEAALRAEDRAAELEMLMAEEKRYIGASTKEGKERLAEIRRRIDQLNRDAQLEALRQEKEDRKAAIEEEISDNKKKYDALKADLDRSQQEMLAAASRYAKQAQDQLTTASQTIADSMSNVIKGFTYKTNDMIKVGLEQLRNMIANYQKIMDSITLNPNVRIQGSSSGSLNLAAQGAAGVNVVINDYGDKLLEDKDAVQDYGKELGEGAKNAMRTGVR